MSKNNFDFSTCPSFSDEEKGGAYGSLEKILGRLSSRGYEQL